MTRHLTDFEIESYRGRATSGEELISANDHLAECDQCYRRFNPDSGLEGVYTSLIGALAIDDAASSEHLTMEEISCYVDWSLGDDEADGCRAHIELCGECRDDVEYLRDFKSRAHDVDGGLARSPAIERRRLRGAFSDLVRELQVPPGYRFAALGILLLVMAGGAAWLGGLSLRRENARLRAQIDQVRAENAALNEKAAAESDGAVNPGWPEGNRTGAASDVIVALKDGNRLVELRRDSSITGLESAPTAYQEMAKDALTKQRVKATSIGGVDIGRQGALMGESPKANGFRAVSPAGEAVEPARPTFTWTELPGATSYMVFVKDLRSGREIRSENVSGTRWAPRADLARGHAYAWMVEANVGGQLVRAPATDKRFAQFRVIDASEVEEIERVRAELKASHLLLGLIYAKAGLRSEAEKELKALAESNPDSETARRLYRSIRRK